ncbi:hypothetical protein ACFE04_005075 [Oxalis oulophora]
MGKDQLPAVIMSDIFCRLPVKSLLRFSCLSKQFYSEIQSPDFIKRQQTQSLKSNTNYSLIITDIVDSLLPPLVFQFLNMPVQSVDSNITSLRYDSMDTPYTLPNPIGKARPVGTCNGLLCLYSYGGDVALFNFATRERRKLPQVHYGLCHADYCVYGFGYDESNDDYVVARIVQKARSRTIDEVMLYSLKANAWRKVTNVVIPFASYDRRMGVYANGKLHFVLDDETSSMIVGFDIDFSNYRVVELPDGFGKGKSNLIMSLLNGCLCLYPEGAKSVWVMKEYGVKESWTKIISFGANDAKGFMCPVAYSFKGDKVLVQSTWQGLYWYDLTNKCTEDVKMDFSLPQMSMCVVTVDTLVSLKSRGTTDYANKTEFKQTNKSGKGEDKPKKGSTKKGSLLQHFLEEFCCIEIILVFKLAKLVGSCNILFCLYSTTFPRRQKCIIYGLDYCVHDIGYDESNDDYVAARIINKVMVDSPNANAWRKVTKAIIPFCYT